MAKSIFILVIIFFGAGLSIECYSATQKDTINREEIIKSLKEAHLRDQEPRLIIDSLMRNGIVDGNLFLPAIMQQREWDSINQKIVLPIIDTLIRFEIYDLEPVAYNACWLIIQHAGHDIMTKYTGFVEQLVKREIIPVSSYMAFIDRLQVHQRKAQIYGYQFKRLTDGTMIQFPVLTGQKKKWREWGHRLKTTNFLPLRL